MGGVGNEDVKKQGSFTERGANVEATLLHDGPEDIVL